MQFFCVLAAVVCLTVGGTSASSFFLAASYCSDYTTPTLKTGWRVGRMTSFQLSTFRQISYNSGCKNYGMVCTSALNFWCSRTKCHPQSNYDRGVIVIRYDVPGTLNDVTVVTDTRHSSSGSDGTNIYYYIYDGDGKQIWNDRKIDIRLARFTRTNQFASFNGTVVVAVQCNGDCNSDYADVLAITIRASCYSHCTGNCAKMHDAQCPSVTKSIGSRSPSFSRLPSLSPLLTATASHGSGAATLSLSRTLRMIPSGTYNASDSKSLVPSLTVLPPSPGPGQQATRSLGSVLLQDTRGAVEVETSLTGAASGVGVATAVSQAAKIRTFANAMECDGDGDGDGVSLLDHPFPGPDFGKGPASTGPAFVTWAALVVLPFTALVVAHRYRFNSRVIGQMAAMLIAYFSAPVSNAASCILFHTAPGIISLLLAGAFVLTCAAVCVVVTAVALGTSYFHDPN